jgi:hypothetical protein
MRFRNVATAVALVVLARPVVAQGPDSAQAAQVRAMIDQIARDRPPQAEAAARDLYARLQLQRAVLDSLRQRSLAEYWAEVAQATVQREMLMHQQDSLRQQLMAQLFASEARARALQRDYRQVHQPSAPNQPVLIVDGVPITDTTSSGRERVIRQRLQELITRHMVAEDSLRELEIADVERRLTQIRAETEQRRRQRAELVRQQVDQILRDATRPPE